MPVTNAPKHANGSERAASSSSATVGFAIVAEQTLRRLPSEMQYYAKGVASRLSRRWYASIRKEVHRIRVEREYQRAARPQRFADEATRIGYETAEAVSRLAQELPPEGAELKTQPITFAEEHEDRGLTAIFTAGTVIFTNRDDGAMLVPERSLQILDKLGIPYQPLPRSPAAPRR